LEDAVALDDAIFEEILSVDSSDDESDVEFDTERLILRMKE